MVAYTVNRIGSKDSADINQIKRAVRSHIKYLLPHGMNANIQITHGTEGIQIQLEEAA